MSKMDRCLYGWRPVQALLGSGQQVKKVYVAKGSVHASRQEVMDLCQSEGVTLLEKSDRFLAKLAGTEKHQGVVVTYVPRELEFCFEGVNAKPRLGSHWLCLYLDRIQDPQNLGAMVRSAEYFAVDQVYYPEHHGAPFNPTAMKASAGAGVVLPPYKISSTPRLMEQLGQRGFKIFGTSPDTGLAPDAVDFNQDLVLIIGNEHEGMGKSVSRFVDQNIKVPVPGRVNSLNASVSTGILLYEIQKARQNLSP